MAEVGNKGSVQLYAGIAYSMFAGQVVAEGVPQSQFAGLWFVFDIVGEADVTFYDDNWGDLTTTLVPEPMSMVLLGLGGLLLRRRK